MSDTALLAQLQAWREKGFDPQLWGTPKGRKLILNSAIWNHPEVYEDGKNDMRFSGAWYPTPRECIEATLKVVQP